MIDSIADFRALPASEQQAIFKELCKLPEAIKEHLSYLQKKVKYHLTAELDMSQDRRTSCFHSSALSYYKNCPRIAWYDYNGATKDPHSTDTQLIFHTGHAFHAMLQSYLIDIRDRSVRWEDGDEPSNAPEPPIKLPEAEIEVPIWDEDLRLSGHIDLVAYWASQRWGDVRFNGEIKSMRDKGWLDAEKAGKPFEYHLDQANAYCHYMDAPFMLFIYINKNNSKIQCFVAAYDPKRFEETREMLEKIQAMDKVPSVRNVSFRCRDCDFNRTCKPGRYTKKAGG